MDKKPSLYDLFNDDSLWGNQTAGDLSHDEIMDKKWNVITANKEKSKDPNWIEAQRKGYLEYLNNPDYVNPRGMLGKKRSKASLEQFKQKMRGRPKTQEHNEKLRNYYKDKKITQEVANKISNTLTGRSTNRGRPVETPAGIFDKLNDAAEHYNVSPGSIKNFINGNTVKESFKKQLEDKGIKFNNLKPIGFKWVRDIDTDLGAKKLYTPDGVFNNVNEAALFYSISATAIRYRVKHWNNWHYIEKNTIF